MLDMIYNPPSRNPGKPIKWILFDSLIIAGIAFLSSLPSDRLPNVFDMYVAVKAFAYSFLIQMAVERGIKPYLARKNDANGNGGGK
ncbi:MAG: hypothetical protein LM583_10565 [Desulfurococcaceae archaeon]|nr:hypothetical protein [Desulfurococcaceae archaeon]